MILTQLWKDVGRDKDGTPKLDLISRGSDVEVGGATCVYIGPCPGDRFYFWIAQDDIRWLTSEQLKDMGFEITCKMPILKGK